MIVLPGIDKSRALPHYMTATFVGCEPPGCALALRRGHTSWVMLAAYAFKVYIWERLNSWLSGMTKVRWRINGGGEDQDVTLDTHKAG